MTGQDNEDGCFVFLLVAFILIVILAFMVNMTVR